MLHILPLTVLLKLKKKTHFIDGKFYSRNPNLLCYRWCPLIGAPGVFFFIVFMPAIQNTKGRMVGYADHKTYGDPPFTKTLKVIQTDTSYKLAEIIRDTYPQLFYLKGAKHNERKAERPTDGQR